MSLEKQHEDKLRQLVVTNSPDDAVAHVSGLLTQARHDGALAYSESVRDLAELDPELEQRLRGSVAAMGDALEGSALEPTAKLLAEIDRLRLRLTGQGVFAQQSDGTSRCHGCGFRVLGTMGNKRVAVP